MKPKVSATQSAAALRTVGELPDRSGDQSHWAAQQAITRRTRHKRKRNAGLKTVIAELAATLCSSQTHLVET